MLCPPSSTMRGGLSHRAPPILSLSSRIATQIERRAGLFIRHTSCKHVDSARSYQTISSACIKRFPLYNLRIRDFSPFRSVVLEGRLGALDFVQRRQKSRKARNDEKEVIDAEKDSVIGDDPPLFDKKPGLWGRWVYMLLVVDVLFVGINIDLVMRNWTHVVDTSSPPTPPESDSNQDSPSSASPGDRYQLRPLWQRLALSGFELSMGVLAGALILASQDRVIWRLRVQRVPINSLPPSRPGMRPPPAATSSSQKINVLAVETGSGRKKRFLMRDCMLLPGRDLSELIIGTTAVKTQFMLSMNGARVLDLAVDNVSDSEILSRLARDKEKEEDVEVISYLAPGGMDAENEGIRTLRKALALAWVRAGGSLTVPKVTVLRGRWTSGPVTEPR